VTLQPQHPPPQVHEQSGPIAADPSATQGNEDDRRGGEDDGVGNSHAQDVAAVENPRDPAAGGEDDGTNGSEAGAREGSGSSSSYSTRSPSATGERSDSSSDGSDNNAETTNVAAQPEVTQFDARVFISGLPKGVMFTAEREFSQDELSTPAPENSAALEAPWMAMLVGQNQELQRLSRGGAGTLDGLAFGDILYGVVDGRNTFFHIAGFHKLNARFQDAIRKYLFRRGAFRGLLRWAENRGFFIQGSRLSASELSWINSTMFRRMSDVLLAEVVRHLFHPSTPSERVEQLQQMVTDVNGAIEQMKQALASHHDQVGNLLTSDSLRKKYKAAVDGADVNKDPKRVKALLDRETKEFSKIQKRCQKYRQSLQDDKKKIEQKQKKLDEDQALMDKK